MKTKFFATIFFFFGIVMNDGASLAESLSGEIGSSRKWGSGWLDLTKVQDFQKGDKLSLRVGGSAERIVVRILQRGVDPNTPAGIVGVSVEVPTNRLVEITVDAEITEAVQISVHGKSSPWGLYDLGEQNGPATLVSVAVLRSRGSEPEKPHSEVPTFTRLQGEIGSSPRWGSGWLDLAELQDFHTGDKLRLRVGGNARKILVRILQKGVDPNTPAGIVGSAVNVPANRLVEITVAVEITGAIQISVHGKSNPWGLYHGSIPCSFLIKCP